MSQLSRDELEKAMQAYVGRQIGAPQVALDAVNEAMIRHWCEAMGDRNPIYTDAAAARAAGFDSIVAPPSMMQAWILDGMAMADPDSQAPTKQRDLHALLSANGYTGVVATNTEQSYTRYLRPGDRISATTTIESISEQKATALGIGYFINTRDVFVDRDGNEVGWQTFRVLKFKPNQAAQAEAAPSAGAAAKPKRMRAPMGYDNAWWWEGVQRGELLIQKCSACGTLYHPPRPMCGRCRSVKLDSIRAAGKGTVYSHTVLHHPKIPGFEYPLICVVVELEEGTRLVSNLVGCEASAVRIGMAVELSIETVDDDLKLPLFRPAA